MCGRFAFYSPDEAVTRLFGVADSPPIEPRYNIAPTQFVPIVHQRSAAARTVAMMRWGLVPFWARDKAIGNRMINARAETLTVKPAYRDAFRKRRCLVPANGFFEWQKRGSTRQPYYINLGGDKAFAMAGLWASWRDKDDPEQHLHSFTIVTTTPSEKLSALHDRMPVILDPQHYAAWLDPANDDTGALQSLLQPYDAPEMVFWPVSRDVNDPRNERPELVQRIVTD